MLFIKESLVNQAWLAWNYASKIEKNHARSGAKITMMPWVRCPEARTQLVDHRRVYQKTELRPLFVAPSFRTSLLLLLCLAACPRASTTRHGKSDGTPGLHCRDSQDASLLPVSLFCCFKRTRFSEERSLHAIHAAKKFVRIRRDGTFRGVHGKRTGNWGFNFKTWIFTACQEIRKIGMIKKKKNGWSKAKHVRVFREFFLGKKIRQITT